MARAIWSGSISFGLVNVPVRMYSAIDEKDLHFHLLHTKDDSRIGYEKICKKEGKAVPDDEIGTAYQVSDRKYVYLTDEDFAAAEPTGPTLHRFDGLRPARRDRPHLLRTHAITSVLPTGPRRCTRYWQRRWKGPGWPGSVRM